ncbi:hypothetical protein [Aliiroseovarius sp. F20344]|uniref:hypothetical protein n=1 Tax=Aliiroseovarius sp. F20344 TaxID=2926414 RepID=UPI001FF64E2A|nr:hypothetical protein [Aliiroseovarius sp. F20344]MCK0142634.1 hypothetical protein [Aliiroseovarius sp. F20344]
MRKRIAAHRHALLVWTVCLFALMFGAVATTAVLDLNGPGYEYALIAFVWLVVVLFVHTAASTPIYTAFLEPDGRVSFVWQYPHKRVSRILEPAAIPEPEIVTSRDSDGDRRVVVKITFSDGFEFIVAEPSVQTGQSQKSEDRKLRYCERACARFSDAISQS